jgi:hypothetical protein
MVRRDATRDAGAKSARLAGVELSSGEDEDGRSELGQRGFGVAGCNLRKRASSSIWEKERR